MPQWLRRWSDWAIPDLFSGLRRPAGPTAQGLLIAYEKAGLIVRQEPIPWNADRVRVEALLRIPVPVVRRKADFTLRCGDQAVGPETIRAEDAGLYRMLFTLDPPRAPSVLELTWRGQPLGQAALPLLREEVFFDHLHLNQPTLAVQLGGQMAVCEAYLSAQGKAVLAGGVLSSPTSLAPLAGQDLRVELIDEKAGAAQTVVSRLTAGQLAQRETLWQTLLPKRPRRSGSCQLQWAVGDRVLARKELRALARRAVPSLLECRGSQFVRKRADGTVELLRRFAAAGPDDWVSVVFLVAAKEPGLALTAPVQVFLRRKDGLRDALPLLHEELLATDGPTPVVPPLLTPADLKEAASFELVCQGALIGHASASPTPEASFTSEGGYRGTTEEFPWSPTADEELRDRLRKLTEKVG